MIFLTVGTQLPFDRLVRAVDDWAGAPGAPEVFGQIAEPGRGGYRPRNFGWTAFLDPAEFDRRFAAASCIVAHAGMGTIIGALAAAKPLLVMPRRAALGEQRNDHQIATARRFSERALIVVATEAGEVGPGLDRLSAMPAPAGPASGPPEPSPELIAALGRFVRGEPG